MVEPPTASSLANSQCVGRGACGCRGEVRGRYNYLYTPTLLFDLVAFAFRSTQVSLAPFVALVRSQVFMFVDRQLVHGTSLSSSCKTGFRYPAVDVLGFNAPLSRIVLGSRLLEVRQ